MMGLLAYLALVVLVPAAIIGVLAVAYCAACLILCAAYCVAVKVRQARRASR